MTHTEEVLTETTTISPVVSNSHGNQVSLHALEGKIDLQMPHNTGSHMFPLIRGTFLAPSMEIPTTVINEYVTQLIGKSSSDEPMEISLAGTLNVWRSEGLREKPTKHSRENILLQTPRPSGLIEERQNQTLTELAIEETTLSYTSPHSAHIDSLSQRVLNMAT